MYVYRSPLKLFIFGLVGIVLMAGAADVIFGHWISTPPDTANDLITTRGQAEQRGDVLWGGAMFATGLLLFGSSTIELIRRRPRLVVGRDGLHLDGAGGIGLIPWESVEGISSAVAKDPFDGNKRERLVVILKTGGVATEGIPGVVREGDTLYIDAHDWSIGVTDAVLSAQGAHDHFLRTEAVRDYEPPSVVWEVNVDQQDSAPTEERPSSDGSKESEV